jgi:hypothetical protein
LYRIGRVTEFTRVIFARSEDDGDFKPKELTMQEAVPQQTWSHRLDEIDRYSEQKQVVDRLQNENNQLKDLVVRLSATIIRNVTAKR